MNIAELRYSVSNNYLITGESGRLLFDTGLAGSFPDFCRAMGELQIPVQSIDWILISHFHPDHCGIAGEIAMLGPRIAVMDSQCAFLHASDAVSGRDAKLHFRPIDDEKIRIVPIRESREFLREMGIRGQILETPGHSDDSISLCLDSGELFVGDLNPLYELPMHRGTAVSESWERLLLLHPKTVYYGHAKKAEIWPSDAAEPARKATGIPASETAAAGKQASGRENDRYRQVSGIIKGIDRHWSREKIQKKTGASAEFVEDVSRMYLTHRNVGVQGILDRIEIKGR